MCELLTFVDKENSELLSQLGRGLANFAESSANTLHMVRKLILKKILVNDYSNVCRLIKKFVDCIQTLTEQLKKITC